MARSGLKIFLMVVLVTVVILAGVAGGVYWLISRGPSISERTVLRIRISGEIPEYSPPQPPFLPSDGGCASMWEIRDSLEKAAVDKRIAAVWVRIEYAHIGWAKVEEISSAIDRFRKSGKPVVAYIDSGDERGYSIALSGDTVFAPGGAFLEMNGLVAEVTHYPGLLEKLGIGIQFERAGKYKSVSGEKFGRKELSPPVREMVESLVDRQYNLLVNRVVDGRKIDATTVRSIFDRGSFFARPAIADRLVDADKDELAVEEYLREKVGEKDDLKVVEARSYSKITRSDAGLEQSRERVAVVFAQGLLVQGRGGYNPIFMEDEQGSDEVNRNLEEAADDERTKAIVLRIDSPGGAGIGPDLICNKVAQIQKRKPVIASMSDYAASGGYWAAMSSKRIIADPSTITGSIGVWSIFPDFSGMNAKLGLTVDIIKRGARSDMLLACRPLDEAERELFRQSVLDMYEEFVTRAAEFRRMPADRMRSIAEGRSWRGDEAVANGLIDEIGGFERAVEIAAKEGKISGMPELWIPGVKSWYETLFEEVHAMPLTAERLARDSENAISRLRTQRILTADPNLVKIH